MGKESELFHAVKNAEVSTIRKFLVKFKSGPKGRKAVNKKLQVNVPDEDGFTALHHAALNNNVEIVLALIEMESDPNSRDKKGMCPLHMAAWSGRDQIVKTLLENRALVNLPSFSGETPLLLASQHGYANVVEILMKFNADPTIRNNNLDSPLDAACQFGHTAVVRLLLMRGEVVHMLHQKQVDSRFQLPLHLAAKGGHVDVSRLLIESGADVNQKTSQGTSLHRAALFGKVEVVKLLLELGADARAVNEKNLTPLDIVNEFTTSRAGIEIKQLLRGALGERVAFARALSDHNNVYDTTRLNFKTGETITVLEQNENGLWKGSIFDGKVEKVGYFPATAVSLISNKKETASTGSLSSSSNSSLNSAASGKETNMKSPSRMAESSKPVGVVPVGTYEVLTLAPSHTSESKKPPNIPRLNSFKKDSKTVVSQRRTLNTYSDVIYDGTSSNRSSSVDTSSDSGLHCSSTMADASYDVVPGSGKSTPLKHDNFYDPLPPSPAKMPKVLPSNPPAKHSNVEPAEHHVISDCVGSSHQKYAEVSFHHDENQHMESPMKQPIPGYSDVYIAENRGMTSPRLHSEARDIQRPLKVNRKTDFRESYENMYLNEELLSKFGRPSESNTVTNNRPQGPEEMNTSTGSEPFPSPPPLNLSTQSPSVFDNEEMPPSPPKKIESRAINYRHTDKYENVQPRQIVPVQVQSPFDGIMLGKGNAPSLPLKSSSSPHAEYENVFHPMSTMPARHASSYENYRPMTSEPQKLRSSTVAAKPSPVKPVPLPPKLSQSNIQEPLSPGSPSPIDPVRFPFLSNFNVDALNEDERELFNWLVELKLLPYYENFDAEGYDMVSVRGISPEDLTSLNITKAGHRKKLLSEVTKLESSPKLPAHKPDDVGTWLKLLGLRQYESNFIEGGFDEMDFIKDLDQSDLEMIDIKKKGHQKKLLLAVQKLSDVDLTAELDDFVAGNATSPIATTSALVQNQEQQHQQQQQKVHLTSPLHHPPHPSLLKTSSNEVKSSNSEQLNPISNTSDLADESFFPPPPSANELDSTLVLTRDALPSRSVRETTSHSPDQVQARAPPTIPTRTISEKPANQRQPQIRARTVSAPIAPKPKPKPRPPQKNMGKVRTASEYHAAELKSSISPSAVAKSDVIVEETEVVTASKSRDFWLQNQQQQQQSSQDEAPAIMRTKSVSGIKPFVSPRPSTKVASPNREIQGGNSQYLPPASPSENQDATVRKMPPPAPPRKDSIQKKKDESAVQDANEVRLGERSRTYSGPLDEKIRQAFRGNAQKGSTIHGPITEKPLEENVAAQPVAVNSTINDELQATDSMMADIDDMIADFTSQLDSMFDDM